MKNFFEALNESTNLQALAILAAGVVLVLKGHPDSGIITGAFALLTASSKKTQSPNQG